MFGLQRIVARPAVGAARMAIAARGPAFTAVRHSSGSHASENESYEAFNSRYQTFFTQVEDVFELQRGLNNCFAYDLVPATEVVEAALRASRKVNDYATAVRILEGVKEKVENKLQYQAYLDELKPVIQELGVNTKEELYNI
ncbi:Cytochrome c oxidase subunit 6 [Naganishia albida]|nr:Cytochrome c oxidase subunit 6 [Naganishia albida]